MVHLLSSTGPFIEEISILILTQECCLIIFHCILGDIRETCRLTWSFIACRASASSQAWSSTVVLFRNQWACTVWHFLFPSLSNNFYQVQIHASSGKKKIQYVQFHIWKIPFVRHRLQDFPVRQVTYFPLSVAWWLEILPKTWSITRTKWEVLRKQTEVKADRSVTLGGWKLEGMLWKQGEYWVAINKPVLL